VAHGPLTPKHYRDGQIDINTTNIKCARCGDTLAYTEEVWRLRIVQAQVLNGDVVYHDILNEEGRQKYQAHFFEFICWETSKEELLELYEEAPCAVEHPLGILRCDICESDILEWETFGLVEYGELHFALRSPLGLPVQFEHLKHEHHVCICCLYQLDAGEHNYWNGNIEPIPDHWVCQEGLFDRCWRQDECHCARIQREYEEYGAIEEQEEEHGQ
jgi:hypothetical protein